MDIFNKGDKVKLYTDDHLRRRMVQHMKWTHHARMRKKENFGEHHDCIEDLVYALRGGFVYKDFQEESFQLRKGKYRYIIAMDGTVVTVYKYSKAYKRKMDVRRKRRRVNEEELKYVYQILGFYGKDA